MAWFDENAIVATLQDGRVMAYAKRDMGVVSAGALPVAVRVPDLRLIEYVIQIQINVDPLVEPGFIVNKKITGNVVGFTLYAVSAGTTLNAEVIAIGPP